MAAKTFVYLDIAVSNTVYQTTTTATTAFGAGKVLVAVAQNGAATATFSLTETSFITGDMVLANTIVANKMNVTTLSSIVANLGTVTAGNITVTTGGNSVGLTPGASTAFYSGPTGSPTVTITQTGVLTATGATINGSSITFEAIFGDGSDGDVTINADTSLSSDMYYNNLTVNSTKNLTCNGYRIFVKNTLTNNGTIKANGNSGTNASGTTLGNGGGATPTGSILGGVAGGNGSGGGSVGVGSAGQPGTSITKGIGANGIIGGAGGTRTGGYTGGTGGAAGTITGTIYNKVKNFTSAYNLFDIFPGSVILPFYASAGSGGGGAGGQSSDTNYSAGGGGGGSAGIC